MAQGPLIEQKLPGDNSTIYVPAKEATPQPVPKLRGMHHPGYVRKGGQANDRPNTYLDQGGASSNEDAQPAAAAAGVSAACLDAKASPHATELAAKPGQFLKTLEPAHVQNQGQGEALPKTLQTGTCTKRTL
jgi:hypothetical protein